MTNKTKTKIVVAWTDDAMEIAPNQTWRADLGERPRAVEVKAAHACMWTSAGTAADLAKAHAFIAKEYPTTGRVFSFATSERDPLVRARREILASR